MTILAVPYHLPWSYMYLELRTLVPSVMSYIKTVLNLKT